MSYKSDLQSNNTDLQQILNKVNTLPNAITLPTLSNPAGAENIEAGYQSIDSSGNLLTGLMAKGYSNFTIKSLWSSFSNRQQQGYATSAAIFTPESGHAYLAAVYYDNSYYAVCFIENGAIKWQDKKEYYFEVYGGKVYGNYSIHGNRNVLVIDIA